MKKPKRLLAAIPLAIALLVPAYANTQDHDRDEHHDHDKRYYDKKHKDYHNWNAGEDGNWQRYQEERHEKHTDWDHASRRQQQEYWNWRHQHGDDDRH